MAKIQIEKGTTDVTQYIFIQDSSQTDGRGLTGLVFNSPSLVCYYVRPLGNATSLGLITQTVTGAHADGGFVEVSSANMPGLYRLDLSDAVCATGVNSVVVMLKGAANMAPVVLEIQLLGYDPSSTLTVDLNPDAVNSTSISADGAEEIANMVWLNEAGDEPNQISPLIRVGIAVAGSANTVTLDAGASATNDAYNNYLIKLSDSDGVYMESAYITDYVGATQVATLDHNFIAFTPDAGDPFIIYAMRAGDGGITSDVNIVEILGNPVNSSVTGSMDVNVRYWFDDPVPAPHDVGVPIVSTDYWVGDGVGATTPGVPNVNVIEWEGSAVATPTVAGVPEIDVTHWNGTAVATPDTVGYPKVTIKDGVGQGEIALTGGAIDNVTTVGTLTTNNDKTGYRLSSTGVDDILDEAITEPGGVFTWGAATLRNIMGWLGALASNRIEQTSSLQTLRDRADTTDIATANVSDDGTTAVRDSFT